MKNLFLYLIVFLLSPLSLVHADSLRKQEVYYLSQAVSSELLPFSSIEIPAIENIQIGKDGNRSYLSLRNYKGQPLKNNGVRAEVSIDYPFRAGQTVVYEWNFRIPNDFIADPENRWWVIADWHDQPDRNKGETWDGYPSRSPPIGFGYGAVKNQDLMSLSYGSPDPVTIGLIPIQRGVWHHIKAVIYWSHKDDGKVSLYFDQRRSPVLQADGPNMHNDFQHYLKIGSYRHPEIEGDSWIDISGVKIKTVPSR